MQTDTYHIPALLGVALRWDLPKVISRLESEVSTCLSEGYLEDAGEHLRVTLAGERYLDKHCGPYFAQHLIYFNPSNWFLDNVYFCPKEATLSTPELSKFIRRRLSEVAVYVNDAMCALGDSYRHPRKCWHTIKDLKDLGYYGVTSKNDYEMAWRFLWEEKEFKLGRMRLWRGTKDGANTQ